MDQGNCISKIYDAATNITLWDEALDAVSQYTGAKACTLISTNLHLGGDTHISMKSKLWRDLSGNSLNFLRTTFSRHAYETWIKVSNQPCLIVQKDTMKLSDQRQDMVFSRINLGISRRFFCRLSDRNEVLEFISLQFDSKNKNVSPGAIEAFSNIVKHLAKAVELNRTLALHEQQYRALHTTLDSIHIGICIAKKGGEVIVSNTEAQRILGQRDALWLSPSNKLVSKDKKQIVELGRAVDALIDTKSHTSRPSETLMSFECSSNKRSILAELVPLAEGLTTCQSSFEGTLIFLIDPENPTPIKISRVAIAYGLSQAESAVCERLAHGWKNRDIAIDRNVSVDTIKTHVAHVFAKTSVRNRSELVRLILKISPPVA